ncbi:hypothetical protein SUGI_1112390 [Cryptomeria japonica]|uniref:chlorophyllase-2 n=1 Tax=Cryptomeria japonica TaxID=3369 RepID=UPI002414831D|nr:chlorophyllase-2 [Cryptomeria japonica]GLJ52296.1 hypothetical protein SUGI_1112390 [Cryptomeria japonica]
MGRKTNFFLVFLLSILLNNEIVEGDSSVSGDVFMEGPFTVKALDMQTWGPSLDKSLLVAVPTLKGTYPVLLFLHSYVPLRNNFYWDFLHQVASHGYIAVAPLLYDFTGWDCTQEMIDTASISDWLKVNLHLHFPAQLKAVVPDFDRFAIAGHGRGGKVAFGVALGLAASTAVKISALAGFDPVDGAGDRQNPPTILTYSNTSLPLSIPALIVGTGLGSKRTILLPACAPERLGHDEFFNESPAPAYHFVASDYGVNDILNNELFWLPCLLCQCRIPLEPMRRFAAGVLVAFLRSAMEENGETFEYILKNPAVAPVRLEPPQYKVLPDFVPPEAAIQQEPQILLVNGMDVSAPDSAI